MTTVIDVGRKRRNALMMKSRPAPNGENRRIHV